MAALLGQLLVFALLHRLMLDVGQDGTHLMTKRDENKIWTKQEDQASTLSMGVNGGSDDEQEQTYMQTICGHWMNETLTFQTSAQFHTFLATAPRPIHNTTVLLSWYNGGAGPATLIGYPIGSSMSEVGDTSFARKRLAQETDAGESVVVVEGGREC
ncbi:hypothetical protein SISNIDRAFT_518963 [Sistotremastrum niveocremeum HHB9708]|uniref:Uncharacterized protein n=1 Tax=Sistotremastrum niveocremeum HHB9708 TaxID=1314777 RepID=A0A164RQW5_9AGAM|nr:hypothetical protein SISNIDRAFT_518963 [Sistotremastrum niveocremeum HHB9708]